METVENAVIVISSIGIGLILGYLIANIRMKNKEKENGTVDHKNLAENSLAFLTEDERKRNGKKIKELAAEILKISVRKQESFVKVMKEFSIPSEIATFSIIVAILKNVKILYFDELVDILTENYKDALPEQLNIQKRQNSSIDVEKFLFVMDWLGLKPILSLLKDENFKDENSLSVFQKIEEKYSTDYLLVKYICEGDGKKHWDKPEAENLIISALVEIQGISKDKRNTAEKALIKHFSEEFQIIESLSQDSEENFIKVLKKSNKEKIAKVFRYVNIEDDYSALSLLTETPEFFKVWLENTQIISDDVLFSYLVWNDILPENFREDNRYSQAKKTQEVYEFSKIDLKSIKDFDSNKNLIEYLKNHCDEEAFIDDYINDKKFIPCLFWYTLEDGKWNEMSLINAQDKLNEYEHDTPYLHASYVVEGYKFTKDVLKKICDNEVIEIVQLYFDIQHKKYFN